MSYKRRQFLQHSGVFAAGVVASGNSRIYGSGMPGQSEDVTRRFMEPNDRRSRELIEAAVTSSIAAGATYADARLSFTQNMVYPGQPIPIREEGLGFGVRALYDGYWGLASSPVWTVDEAARLGQAAVAQARVNAVDGKRDIELATNSGGSGDWKMPIQIDPFEMSYDEIIDFMEGLKTFIGRLPHVWNQIVTANFMRQYKYFGNSGGQYTSQCIYRTSGSINFTLGETQERATTAFLDCLTPAGLGFEYFREQPLRNLVRKAHEEALEDLKLPIEPVDVGRYSMLIEPFGCAQLVSKTLGIATELDRALGYEANAGGTSYLNDPTQMLGQFKVGNSLLNVSAERSEAGSVATTKWDDEGVAPVAFDLIRNGIIVNAQTNLEGAGWIKDYLMRTQSAVKSFGCATTPDAIHIPLTQSANLKVGANETSGADMNRLREEMGDGMEFKYPAISLDFQQISGLGRGMCYRIKGGKRTATVPNSGFMFRTPELLQNLIQLGDESSVRRYGIDMRKGEPAREGFHSVSTPPLLFKDTTFIDVQRKA